jgi:hypothetical protein
MKEIKEILKNSKVQSVICVLGAIFVALIIFQAGMFVGFKKAGFAFKTGEQYFRQMRGMPNDNMMGMNRNDFPNTHGAVGKIISIKLPSMIVLDKNNIEKTVLISSSTDIKKFKDTIKSTELNVNDFVTIIGDPNDNAEINAVLIRIMPDPESIPAGEFFPDIKR